MERNLDSEMGEEEVREKRVWKRGLTRPGPSTVLTMP